MAHALNCVSVARSPRVSRVLVSRSSWKGEGEGSPSMLSWYSEVLGRLRGVGLGVSG